MNKVNNQLVYLQEKEKGLEKIAASLKGLVPEAVEAMMNLGRSVPHTMHGIGRAPVADLYGSLARSGDIGKVVAEVSDLNRRALLGRGSIRTSYADLLGKSNTSPLSMLRKARDTVYSPLGKGFNHSGATLKEVAERDIENSIFTALAKQSHQPEVAKYAKNLVENRGYEHSELNSQIKKVMNDYIEGKDPSILIKNGAGDGRHLNLSVDRPIASFNGSPVLNIKKTMGIDGVESFNAKHTKLLNDFNKKIMKGEGVDPTIVNKIERSNKFAEQFGSKLREMSSSADDINRSKFTLDDLDSVEKVQTFFNNPHIEEAQKLLPDHHMDAITNEIVDYVHGATKMHGHDPAVVKDALAQKLSSLAADPSKANYLQSFQFERYSPEEMKKVMEAVRGTKRAATDEAIRLGADALGAATLTGMLGMGAYGALKPKEGLQHELQPL